MLLELRAALMGGVHASLAMKGLTVVHVRMGTGGHSMALVKVCYKRRLLTSFCLLRTPVRCE